jgi:hypothetical protein
VVPHYCFTRVFGHPVAQSIANAEADLGAGVSFVGGFSIPLHGLGLILGHAEAIFVVDTQFKLGPGFTPFGLGAKFCQWISFWATLLGW